MSLEQTATRRTYAGLFLVTQVTLMYEILLTRIFSVTMWYHFAFMAISIAMFGMTAGAILVYLFPSFFPREATRHQLGIFSLGFSLTIVLSFLLNIGIAYLARYEFTAVSLTYLATAIPFLFSGICVTLALTRFPGQLGRMYSADLAGAASGCILLILTLRWTDGPTAVFILAILSSCASVFFLGDRKTRSKRFSILSVLLLLCFTIAQTLTLWEGAPILRLKWVKGSKEPVPLYEKWNSFSRVRVVKDPGPGRIFGWGMSPACSEQTVKELKLDIDAGAATVLTAFNGNLKEVDFLKCDITNIAHTIRPNSNVMVIGVGGGRDLLSALVFRQKSVTGVEINDAIADAVNKKFGDFTGHLDRYAGVTFVNDEARGFITRQQQKFGIIQASLIDTYAATAAGAFVLSEHSIYTLEAWKVFLRHLEPNGVLTFSRWYLRVPTEVWRLTALATVALHNEGVQDPRKNIVIVAGGQSHSAPVGNILVSMSPFSQSDLDTLEDVAGRRNFQIVLSPRHSASPVFEKLSSINDLNSYLRKLPIDITPPTDNRPFFFYTMRLKDALSRSSSDPGMQAVFILAIVLVMSIVLTFLFIFVPLYVKTHKEDRNGSWPFLLYFASIGFGFLLIEISQMQRLIIFLGHPTYGLSVVLFALLLAGGIGSLTTQALDAESDRKFRFAILLAMLFLFGTLTPFLTYRLESSSTFVRILTGVLILFPPGFFMGMAFPFGMKLASIRFANLTPWLWGINGATSVCASVLAVAISLSWGISTTYWIGFVCYIVAFACLLRTTSPVPQNM